MDFLKIREKAKAKAAERDAAKGPDSVPTAAGPDSASKGGPASAPKSGPDAAPKLGRDAGAPRAGVPGGAPPGPDPVVTEADVLEGQLAARLQGLPPAGDARFTTWRPGSGAPPVVAPAPLASPPQARQGDFTVIAPAARAPAPSPAPVEPASPQRDALDDFFYREGEEAPEVPAIVGAAEGSPEAAEDPAREEYLTFALGDETYAVPIECVREVMKSPPITEVPGAPAPVLGVVTVRGEVVAVFDPRRRLALPGLAPAAGLGRVVVVDAGEGPCGLLVDAVSSVVRLRPGSIEPRPHGLGGPAAECLEGIGRWGSRLFTVLDLAAFFRRPAPSGRRGDEEDRHAGA